MIGIKSFFSKDKNEAENLTKQISQMITGSLTSIVIPHSIEKIGNYAFAGQSQLKNIVFLGSIKEIGEFAFCDCT